jgi:hypothetical protein
MNIEVAKQGTHKVHLMQYWETCRDRKEGDSYTVYNEAVTCENCMMVHFCAISFEEVR